MIKVATYYVWRHAQFLVLLFFKAVGCLNTDPQHVVVNCH